MAKISSVQGIHIIKDLLSGPPSWTLLRHALEGPCIGVPNMWKPSPVMKEIRPLFALF